LIVATTAAWVGGVVESEAVTSHGGLFGLVVGAAAPVVDGSTVFSILAPLEHIPPVPCTGNISYIVVLVVVVAARRFGEDE
jgi:hypothetical protein